MLGTGQTLLDAMQDYPLELQESTAKARLTEALIGPDGETTWEMDRKRILWSAMDLTERRPPLSRWQPEWKEAFEGFEP